MCGICGVLSRKCAPRPNKVSAMAGSLATNGTLWLAITGEVYNFRELRRSLEGRHQFRSQGDGEEVILHLKEEKGDAAVAELDGVFASALWDATKAAAAAGRLCFDSVVAR